MYAFYARTSKRMKTKIHVNQHIIKKNATTGQRKPPLTVKTYKSNVKARSVLINGPCRVVYRPDDPLDCGARVWIETDSEVLVDRIPTDKHHAIKAKNKICKKKICAAYTGN